MFKWLRRWNYVREEYTETFLGEEVKRVSEDVRFRFNDRVAQEKCFAFFSGPYWRTLSEDERKVLLTKIVKRGNGFVLPVGRRKSIQRQNNTL
jgi:hypothetical protein